MKSFDSIIIGGGFYGLRIAQFLREELNQNRILVIEKESEVMQRASKNNQARIHGGYHYPRSVLTALRSQVNMPVFSEEFSPAVVSDFTNIYGVANTFSKVSARQFYRFFDRINAKLEISEKSRIFFDAKLIEEVFKVEEFVFSSNMLKVMVMKKLAQLNVDVHTGKKVINIKKSGDFISVQTSNGTYEAPYIINTTYSSINTINKNSGLPVIPFKHELTEMCLVTVPENIRKKAFTIMCGPYFSLMPYPDKDMYTLSHVRYTPHSEWHDSESYVKNSHEYLGEIEKISHFPQMIADLKRYMPSAKEIKYTGESIWEIKTVLPQSEADDSRPILYKDNHGDIQNYICILGGKIDNIYDVFRELKLTYGQKA